MRIYRVLVQRIRSIFRRNRVEADLQREMALHLEALTREFVAAGVAEAEARDSARREFGAVEVGPIRQSRGGRRETGGAVLTGL